MCEYKVNYDVLDKRLAGIAEKFRKRLKSTDGVTLKLDKSLDEFEGKIENGVISAGSYAQLLDTAGRYLRNPKIKNGVFSSYKKVCGMYFCTHNWNYTHEAPLEEIYEYMDDLAFWGMNTFGLWFDMHHYKSMEDGMEDAEKFKKMITHAKNMGIKTVMNILPNETFWDSPKELRADWTCGHDGYIYPLSSHYHMEICPSKQGGIEKIIEYRRQMLDVFAEAEPDGFLILPYDQGGCSCADCAPWGGNGLIKTCEAIIPVIKEYLPKAEIMLSLWQFGTFTGTEVEFEMLIDAMNKGHLSEITYLMSEPQYATYAVTHDMPRPVINFPEISMYAAYPWGGYGANPLPKLYEDLWNKYRDKLEGGMPYSEGIFEDINKIINLRFYRDNQSAAETVREYLAYEFGLSGEILEKTHRAVMDMEETLERQYRVPYKKTDDGIWVKMGDAELTAEPHRYIINKPEKVFEIEKAIIEADATLPEKIRGGIKWQLIYLRAVIDGELVRNDYRRNDKVMEYFKKLVSISHLENSGPFTKPDIDE